MTQHIKKNYIVHIKMALRSNKHSGEFFHNFAGPYTLKVAQKYAKLQRNRKTFREFFGKEKCVTDVNVITQAEFKDLMQGDR